MSKDELEKALKKLYENYEKLLEQINFNGKYECICGTISEKITDFFRNIGIKANYISGKYIGRGTEFSGGKSTSHCWVELNLKLKDIYPYQNSEIKVIIDGAYAQFFPFELTPRITRDKQRLTIFINDKTAEQWYIGFEDNWRWEKEKNAK
jgi:hypothetical protein